MTNNRFDLTGKVAVVTGGAGILGSEFSRTLAEHGANVAVVDLNNEGAFQVAKDLKKEFGINSIGVECNVANPESAKSMVNKVVKEFGKIDILCNNAATKTDNLDEYFATLEDYSLETWRKIMSVNIDGMFLVAQAVGKQMLEQGTGGSIVQTSSIYGILGPDNRIYEGSSYLRKQINTSPAYAASKGAVISLTKYLATYWADKGIRVNTITPGGVESGQNDTFTEKYSSRVALKRMAKKEEIASAVLYLASDASSYMTGQNFIVDGGLSAW